MMNPLSSSSQQQQRPMRSRRRRTRTTSAAAAAATAVFLSSAALLLHHHDHIYPMNYNNNVVLIVPAVAAAFQGTTTTRQRPSIAVHFRNNENNSAANNAFVLPTTTTATTTTTTTPTAESLLHSNNNNHHRHYHHQHHQRAAPSLVPLLPAWLSIPRSHLAEANLAALQKAMMIPRGDNDDDDDSSFFTESESLQLMAAIQNACSSSGSSSTSSSDSSDNNNNNNSKKADRNMIAGAAEFCLLLVETAEMGLDALIAAAYHYVACVRARQERRVVVSSSSTSSSTTTSTKAWIPMHDDDGATVAASYGGEGVSRIVQDAARLKNLEMIAATVLDRDQQQQQQQDDEAKRRSSSSRSRGSGVGVRPDYHDAENLRKLLLSETKDWRALAIRSAACLYRLRGILLHQHHQQQHQEQVRTVENIRTAREALLIYAPLASRLGMHRLKNELEGAAFRILYPRQFKLVNNLTHQHFAGHTDIGDSMKQVLEAVREDMTKMLQDDEEFSRLVENFSVTARVKEPYSLWKKMLRRGYKTILQVPDALALRIVLNSKKLDPNEDDEVTRARERALCYYAQNLCQQRYKPAADPRIKDYIDAPKENGYQSLHYTANTQWHGQEWTLEIQVRSGLMNSIAEFGLAAHFDYKLATSSSSQQQQQQQQHVADVKIRQNGHNLDNSSAAYLRNVQEWHWKQHGGTWAAHTASASASASSFPEPGFAIWQSRMRADRIRERNERLEPYIQALKTAQWDLARDYVFIFLSDEHSQVLALPAGACVLDALKTIKREEPNILLNGSATSVTRQLHNGDVLAF